MDLQEEHNIEVKQMEDSSHNKDDLTRGHEYYLSHLLFLEQASPIALKAVIKREVDKCGKDITSLLQENKESFKTQYEMEYLQLFQNNVVNIDFEAWDTLQLCAAIFVLFKSCLTDPEVKAIQCIYAQRKDIEKYVEYASLTFNIYKEKQELLHKQLLELIMFIDTQANVDCKSTLFTFEPKSINLSENLRVELKQTNDVKTHLQLALKENVVTQIDIINGEDNQIWQTNGLNISNHIFTEELQNKNVYINDSAVLRCKLNSPANETVVWKKDCKPVEMTDNIVFMGNHCTHWLAITHASLEDTGKYACECGNISTSANLTVIDETLSMVFNLPVQSNVTENRNISLECGVNMRTSKSVWRHKGEVVQSSSRYVIQAKGTKHTLTIMNVTFQDEGEYTVDFGEVSSKTTVVVQGEADVWYRRQLTEELFQNWVRSVIALKYLKVGLEEFSDKAVQKHHDDILSNLEGTCNTCTEESLLPHKQDQCPHQYKQKCLCSKNQKQKSRKMCPNVGFCGKFYARIVCDHRFRDPLYANTNVQKWSCDPWSVAACFVNTTGYKGKKSAKDVDCSGLLSMIINNVFIAMMLGEDVIDGKSDAFSQAREARNDIHHNSNYELSKTQLDNFLNLFREVLKIKDKHGYMPLKDEPSVKEALRLLDVVQQNQINIDHEMQQLRDHGMDKLEEKYQTAKEQLELKLQQMEQQVKDKDNELQLRRILQSPKPNEPFVLDLQIQVIAKNGTRSNKGNHQVYKTMKYYIDKSINETGASSAEISTDKSVYQLLECINAIKECRIVGAFSNQTSNNIKIICLTCNAVGDFLKYINQYVFQQDLFELRRWLHVKHNIETYDIIASCSSESIEKISQRKKYCDLTRNMNCENHRSTPCTYYCPNHDTFFCDSCRYSKHSSCYGIKRFESQMSNGIERPPTRRIFSMKRTYDLTKKDRNPNNRESISICRLPNGEVLLAHSMDESTI